MAQKYEFPGKISRYVADSEPFYPEPAHPGDQAPNVILILLDDTGGQWIAVHELSRDPVVFTYPRCVAEWSCKSCSGNAHSV